MDSQIPDDIAEVKKYTERIHAVLSQVVSSPPSCTCKDKILDLKKDLKALEERVSIKEEECIQQRKTRDLAKDAREKRFEVISTRLDDILMSIRTIQSNQALGAKTSRQASQETLSSSASRTAVLSFGAVKPIQILHANTARVRAKRQLERRDSMNLERWQLLASQEVEKVSSVTQPLDGYHTVLLLDISESMASGDSWTRATTFVKDFLAGLEEHSALYEPFRHINEHVGLVTFGHQTQVEVPLTRDFRMIENKIENIELGGPSPLVGGLLVAIAVLQSSQNHPGLINNVSMHHKVIVITDGQPTAMSLSSGPDVIDENQVDEERAILLMMLDQANDAKCSVFFIEVPNSETTCFRCIRSDDPYRNVFACNQGRRLARRNYLSTKTVISDPIGHASVQDGNSTVEDQADMRDIASTTRKNISDLMAARDRKNSYRESNCKTLPIIGSRVRRGPDWKWDNQDRDGPGTLIGHCENDCWVWVEWDRNPTKTTYRYGEGFFDVLVVDEIRRLTPGELMAVGCHVKPGRDGKLKNVHAWNKGVVIKMKPPKARVRWDSGIRGDYSYGADGKFEIEVCDSSPESTAPTEAASTFGRAADGPKHKNKNKASKKQ